MFSIAFIPADPNKAGGGGVLNYRIFYRRHFEKQKAGRFLCVKLLC